MKIKIEQSMNTSKLGRGFLKKYKPDLYSREDNVMSKYAKPLSNYDMPFQKENTVIYLNYEECYFNDCCRFRGHIFLNELYDRLNMSRTKEGQVMGWFWNKERDGMNPVELTMYIDGHDVFVDFNIEGNIYDIFDEIAK
jgi:hypothetical protein